MDDLFLQLKWEIAKVFIKEIIEVIAPEEIKLIFMPENVIRIKNALEGLVEGESLYEIIEAYWFGSILNDYERALIVKALADDLIENLDHANFVIVRVEEVGFCRKEMIISG